MWKLTGRLPRRRLDGKWEYTLAEAERAEAGFEPMDTYIWRMQNMVAQYIAMQSLMGLCEMAERKQGAQLGMWWWKKAVIYLAG